jgi:hypothetical protein
MSRAAVCPDDRERARAQRRTLAVLAVTQALCGAGMSAAVVGLTAARLSGSDGVGGLAHTAAALGAALVAAPLARTATRSGRRPAMLKG